MSVNFTAPNCVSTDTMAVVAVCAPTLLLNRVRVLVVRFGDALPFAVDLQEQKDVREVDLAAPALFENAHDGKSFFEFQHVDARLEVLASADGIKVAGRPILSLRNGADYTILSSTSARMHFFVPY